MDVTLYTTPTCPYCHQVKGFLSQREVSFKEVDVSRDPQAAAEMVRISGQRGVPVTVVDGEAVVGYDPRRLEQLLQRSQRPKLGAAVADAAKMADQGRSSIARGVYVGRVRDGSAAARAGLQVGDVITSLANRPVEDASELEQIVSRLRTGQRVSLTYVRGEQEQQTTLRL